MRYLRTIAPFLTTGCFVSFAFVVLAQEPWKDARLYDAVISGRTEAVKAALDKGQDPSTFRPGFGSLLFQATVNGHLDIVQLLLKHGADPRSKGNDSLLSGAVNAGRLDILKCLVEAGAPVRNQDGPCAQGNVLVEAALKGNFEMVKYLLQHGADPNGTWALGDTSALQVAASRGDVDIVELLVAAGADINHRDWNGMSAFMLACKNGQVGAVKSLLKKGADTTFADGYDRTAEMFAGKVKGDNTAELKALCATNK